MTTDNVFLYKPRGKIDLIHERTEKVIFVNPASVSPHLPFNDLKLDIAISIHLQNLQFCFSHSYYIIYTFHHFPHPSP